jgi:hypothetical protein
MLRHTNRMIAVSDLARQKLEQRSADVARPQAGD